MSTTLATLTTAAFLAASTPGDMEIKPLEIVPIPPKVEHVTPGPGEVGKRLTDRLSRNCFLITNMREHVIPSFNSTPRTDLSATLLNAGMLLAILETQFVEIEANLLMGNFLLIETGQCQYKIELIQ